MSIDYIHLLLSASGNNAALVLINNFTGWIDCIPTPTQSSNGTCLALFRWICQHGLMIQVQCNNGVHFNTEEVKVLMMCSYGVKLRFGVPYHPQGPDKVEIANGVLKNFMQMFAEEYSQEWDAWLPAALYVMRTISRGDHGYSAFFLAYGRQPRDITGNDEWILDQDIEEDKILLKRIDELVAMNLNLIPQARRNIRKYKVKMIERYNRTTKPMKYKIDDLVMVLDRGNSKGGVALLTKWRGPYCVSGLIGQDIYGISDGALKLPFPFHANQMKLYKTRPRVAAELKYYSKQK